MFAYFVRHKNSIVSKYETYGRRVYLWAKREICWCILMNQPVRDRNDATSV
jgi:hypothetical protein